VVRFDISAEQLRPDILRNALTGRVEGVPPSAALALIAQGALPGTDRATAIREIVENTALEPFLRAGAVRAFPRTDVAVARTALSAFLGSDVERVVAEAAGVLGQIGAPEHLPALRRARDGARVAFVQRRIAFAETLIVHRFGITDSDVSFPEVVTVGEAPRAQGGLSFRSGPPGVERRRQAIGAVTDEFAALDAAAQDVIEVQCGPRLMEVVVAREALRDGGRSVARVPALPAVVATQDPEDGQFSAAWAVLTRPLPGGRFSILLVSLGNGDPVYVAEGALDGAEPVFDLRTARSPGVTPVTGQIRLTASGLQITGNSAVRAQPARTPSSE
jgi:hypothetical protein